MRARPLSSAGRVRAAIVRELEPDVFACVASVLVDRLDRRDVFAPEPGRGALELTWREFTYVGSFGVRCAADVLVVRAADERRLAVTKGVDLVGT